MACLVEGNPDLIGVGVRIGVYLQAYSAVIIAATRFQYTMSRGSSDSDELSERNEAAVVVYITSATMVISGLYNYVNGSLSTYHALATLNLLWIQFISSRVFIASTFELDGLWFKLQAPTRSILKLVIRQGTTLSIFTILAGSFGIMIWTGLLKDSPDCSSEVILWLLGSQVPTSDKGLQITSIIIYALFVVPIVIVLLIDVIFALAAIVVWYPFRLYKHFREQHILSLPSFLPPPRFGIHHNAVVLFLFTTLITVFVLITEFTIKINRTVVQDDAENEWGFGQILTLVLTVFSLFYLEKELELCGRFFKFTRNRKSLARQTNKASEFPGDDRPQILERFCKHVCHPEGREFLSEDHAEELHDDSDLGPTPQRHAWFISSPLTADILRSPPHMQLCTSERASYWGFRTTSNENWYEIGLVSPMAYTEGGWLMVAEDDGVASSTVEAETVFSLRSQVPLTKAKPLATTRSLPEPTTFTANAPIAEEIVETVISIRPDLRHLFPVTIQEEVSIARHRMRRKPLTWTSHNIVSGFSTFFQTHMKLFSNNLTNGTVFGPSHKIWSEARMGDRICVYQCLKPGLDNVTVAWEGHLLFFDNREGCKSEAV